MKANRVYWAMLLLVLCPQGAGGPDRQNPATQRATLDNGLQVIVVRNTLAPVATIVITTWPARTKAPEGFPGTAHAQEHMMFRGSPGLTAGQLADIVATMGGMFNADTQQTVTQYFFTVPAEDLDVALHIELIRMRGVLDSEKLWQQEKGAIEQEVAQDLSNPEYVFYTQAAGRHVPGDALRALAAGHGRVVRQDDRGHAQEVPRDLVRPEQRHPVIVGDVRPAAGAGACQGPVRPAARRRRLPEKPAIRLEPVKPADPQSHDGPALGMAVVSFRMPGYRSNDYAASQVLSDVLSSQRGDLYALVPQGKALFAGFSLSTLPEAGLGYAVAAFPQGADPQPLMDEVRKNPRGEREERVSRRTWWRRPNARN